jgi:RNA polymerase sigma-70 factor (ECF subfamily)
VLPSAKANQFAEFYSHSYRRLVAELTLVLGSRAEAEDVAQETFARAWLRWSRLHDFDQPHAWVRRVGYNAAIDRLRAHDRFLRFRHKLAQPETQAGMSADWVDLQAALMRLSAQQRAALVLTAVAGLTTDEAATQLDVPSATLRSWLRRARTAIDAPTTDTPAASEVPHVT